MVRIMIHCYFFRANFLYGVVRNCLFLIHDMATIAIVIPHRLFCLSIIQLMDAYVSYQVLPSCLMIILSKCIT